MSRYVAFLRGIAPTNPNMRNENLRRVCEGLGLDNVQTVISSGNVVFDTGESDTAGLESAMEAAWPKELGFNSTTIVRTDRDLERLVELNPFADRVHTRETYLLVTFAKHPVEIDLDLPHQPSGSDYRIIGATDREVFSVTDTLNGTSLDVMAWMQKRFGEEISSRTWLTVTRILKRMGNA